LGIRNCPIAEHLITDYQSSIPSPKEISYDS
jgi:hypothetical protein